MQPLKSPGKQSCWQFFNSVALVEEGEVEAALFGGLGEGFLACLGNLARARFYYVPKLYDSAEVSRISKCERDGSCGLLRSCLVLDACADATLGV